MAIQHRERRVAGVQFHPESIASEHGHKLIEELPRHRRSGLMADLKPLIAKVALGEALTREEARTAFAIIMSGEATPAQIGAFLMGLRVRGETVDEITGAVEIMREQDAEGRSAR